MNRMLMLVFFVVLIGNIVEMVLVLSGWMYPTKFDTFMVYGWANLGIAYFIINLYDKQKDK